MGKRKLTNRQVVDICKALNKGVTQRFLADKYGVTQTTICQIRARKIYLNVVSKYLTLESGPEHVRGERHGRSKLTEDQVKEIRSMEKVIGNYKLSQRFLSVEFGVSEVTIGHILHRKTWKHID